MNRFSYSIIVSEDNDKDEIEKFACKKNVHRFFGDPVSNNSDK